MGGEGNSTISAHRSVGLDINFGVGKGGSASCGGEYDYYCCKGDG